MNPSLALWANFNRCLEGSERMAELGRPMHNDAIQEWRGYFVTGNIAMLSAWRTAIEDCITDLESGADY